MNELTDRDESGLGWVYPPQPQQTFIQEVIGMISGVIELVEGQDYIDVAFGTPQPTADWVIIEASIFNTTDGTPINIWPGVLTSKTTTGFRLQLNGTPDSGNYFLTWSIRGVFGYYFSGPSSGRRNVASSPFTVRLPDDSTLDGTVIITPTDSGVGGTFTPASVALTLAAPSATFTYTPSTYGPRSIQTDNDRGLIDPVEIGFTAITQEYTLDGPASGTEGVPSTDFTVALPVGGAVLGTITVTPDDGGDGGTFTPTTVELTTAAPSSTFTYTAVSTGAKTISTTNDGGLTDPGSLTFTAAEGVHLLNGLVSYWKFDEVSGTRIDSHGTSNLNDSNTVGSTTGVINNAGSFVAVNSESLYGTIGTISPPFTWQLWIKRAATGSTGIVGIIYLISDFWDGHYIGMTATGFYTKSVYQNNFTGGEEFSSNDLNWHHLVVVCSSLSSRQIYLDGVAGTPNVDALTDPTPNKIRFGAAEHGAATVDNFFDGSLDEGALWTRVLSSTEISALYNSGSGLPYSSFTT